VNLNTALQYWALCPQAFKARTQIFDVLNVVATLTEIVFVVDAPDNPVGRIQAYDVAPTTGSTVNTIPVWPAQTPRGPEIAVGVAGLV
jgi:hypothetical protein